jgi:hypothetical protein
MYLLFAWLIPEYFNFWLHNTRSQFYFPRVNLKSEVFLIKSTYTYGIIS